MDRSSSFERRFSLNTSGMPDPVAESTCLESVSPKRPITDWFRYTQNINKRVTPNQCSTSEDMISVRNRKPYNATLTTINTQQLQPIRHERRILRGMPTEEISSRICFDEGRIDLIQRKLSTANLTTSYKAGQFPTVNLNSTAMSPFRARQPKISMTRIAPPQKSNFKGTTLSSLLRSNSIVGVNTLGDTCCEDPLIVHSRPTDTDGAPPRSVIDALKEISRKRIINNELNTQDPIAKRNCTRGSPELVEDKGNTDRVSLKRARTTESYVFGFPGSSDAQLCDSSSPEQLAKRKHVSCSNDITSSLSSSIPHANKRKFSQHSEPEGSCTVASDLIDEEHAKNIYCAESGPHIDAFPCSMNRAHEGITTAAAFLPELTESSVLAPKKTPSPKILSDDVSRNKRKLTLFNKNYDENIVELNNEFGLETSSTDYSNVIFVKPKRRETILNNKDAIVRTQKSKLAMMLKGLRGEMYMGEEDCDAEELQCQESDGSKEDSGFNNSKASISVEPYKDKPAVLNVISTPSITKEMSLTSTMHSEQIPIANANIGADIKFAALSSTQPDTNLSSLASGYSTNQSKTTHPNTEISAHETNLKLDVPLAKTVSSSESTNVVATAAEPLIHFSLPSSSSTSSAPLIFNKATVNNNTNNSIDNNISKPMHTQATASMGNNITTTPNVTNCSEVSSNNFGLKSTETKNTSMFAFSVNNAQSGARSDKEAGLNLFNIDTSKRTEKTQLSDPTLESLPKISVSGSNVFPFGISRDTTTNSGATNLFKSLVNNNSTTAIGTEVEIPAAGKKSNLKNDVFALGANRDSNTVPVNSCIGTATYKTVYESKLEGNANGSNSAGAPKMVFGISDSSTANPSLLKDNKERITDAKNMFVFGGNKELNNKATVPATGMAFGIKSQLDSSSEPQNTSIFGGFVNPTKTEAATLFKFSENKLTNSANQMVQEPKPTGSALPIFGGGNKPTAAEANSTFKFKEDKKSTCVFAVPPESTLTGTSSPYKFNKGSSSLFGAAIAAKDANESTTYLTTNFPAHAQKNKGLLAQPAGLKHVGSVFGAEDAASAKFGSDPKTSASITTNPLLLGSSEKATESERKDSISNNAFHISDQNPAHQTQSFSFTTESSKPLQLMCDEGKTQNLGAFGFSAASVNTNAFNPIKPSFGALSTSTTSVTNNAFAFNGVAASPNNQVSKPKSAFSFDAASTNANVANGSSLFGDTGNNFTRDATSLMAKANVAKSAFSFNASSNAAAPAYGGSEKPQNKAFVFGGSGAQVINGDSSAPTSLPKLGFGVPCKPTPFSFSGNNSMPSNSSSNVLQPFTFGTASNTTAFSVQPPAPGLTTPASANGSGTNMFALPSSSATASDRPIRRATRRLQR